MRPRSLLLVVPLALSLTGCSLLSYAVERAVDGAVSGAASSAGRRVGEGVGDSIGMSVNRSIQGRVMPQVMQAYAHGLLTMLYFQGGHSFATRAYKPGEYTVWESKGVEQGERIERAFVRREADGKEWWRVRADQRVDDGKVERSVVEALFSKADVRGVQRVMRLRVQMPGESALQELPIAEDEAARWVLQPPSRLTAESLAGATVGIEAITVPAGKYSARHVRFGLKEQATDYWLSDAVPGGLVQYRIGSGVDAMWFMLQETGTGAKLSS